MCCKRSVLLVNFGGSLPPHDLYRGGGQPPPPASGAEVVQLHPLAPPAWWGHCWHHIMWYNYDPDRNY